MVYYYDAELYHHGIKGQKWGVRRFQNADGSLTNAGQKRYEKNINYRNQRSEKLKRLANDRLRSAEEAKAHAENIKKKGYESDEFKQFLRDKENAEIEKYIRENTKTTRDEFGFEEKEEPNPLYVTQRRLMIRAGNDYANKLGLFDQQLSDLQRKYEDDYDGYMKSANHFISRNDSLMKMQVSAFTSKKDFRKASGSSFEDIFY